VICFKVS
jgi:hypothetical protein